MTPAHVAHIMALVNDYAIAVASVAHEMSDKNDFLKLNSARAAVEAALRDAPQAEGWVMVPIDPTNEMVFEGAQCDGVLDYDLAARVWRAMLSASPSAPTAVEPPELSMSMFASVADFEAAKRRAAVEPDERAEFEAWAGPITALAKENGKYVEVMTSLAWEAWQARASKGTPL